VVFSWNVFKKYFMKHTLKSFVSLKLHLQSINWNGDLNYLKSVACNQTVFKSLKAELRAPGSAMTWSAMDSSCEQVSDIKMLHGLLKFRTIWVQSLHSSSSSFFFFFFFFFGGTGVWSQCLKFARQVLYHEPLHQSLSSCIECW
jgi:hypothetical protein